MIYRLCLGPSIAILLRALQKFRMFEFLMINVSLQSFTHQLYSQTQQNQLWVLIYHHILTVHHTQG